MQKEGWEVHSACSYGKDTEGLRAAGYLIHSIKIARSMNPISAIVAIFQLIRLFKIEQFDVVHVHTPVAALVGRVAAKITGVPMVVYTAHGFYFHDQMPRWKQTIYIFLERVGGLFTNLLFTQSAEDAKTAIIKKIMPQELVLAIGNGVDSERFNSAQISDQGEIRNSLGIPPEAFVVGVIGRQVKEKGICEFLDAACEASKVSSEIFFLLIGERLSSDHSADVSHEISTAIDLLGDRLIIAGHREDIPEMLQAMDVFCLPSWREGMPRTIIEAMMMAKPVIATNIRGSREEVLSGQTGILVSVKSPRELAQAILFFASNPDKCIAYGNAGRERALSIYEEAHVVALQIDRLNAACSLLMNPRLGI
jgi:glycosyltransferase involved in cell wall biosynthesis